MSHFSSQSLPDFQRELHKALANAATALDDFVGVRIVGPSLNSPSNSANMDGANMEESEVAVFPTPNNLGLPSLNLPSLGSPGEESQNEALLEGAAVQAFSEMGVSENLVPEQLWLLDAGDLQSTAQVPSRSLLGGLQPWVMGISQLRGQVYTLADMSVILGSPVPPASKAWTTLLHSRFDTSLALVWPDLIGMIPRHELSLISGTGKPTHPWVRRQWRDGEGRIWNELSVEQLVLFKNFDQVWQANNNPSTSKSANA